MPSYEASSRGSVFSILVLMSIVGIISATKQECRESVNEIRKKHGPPGMNPELFPVFSNHQTTHVHLFRNPISPWTLLNAFRNVNHVVGIAFRCTNDHHSVGKNLGNHFLSFIKYFQVPLLGFSCLRLRHYRHEDEGVQADLSVKTEVVQRGI